MSRLIALLAVGLAAALVGGTAGYLYYTDQDKYAHCLGVKIPGTDSIGGDFTLLSETGDLVTAAQVIDKPALVYLGYTFCPDVCPLDIVRNAEAVEVLETQGIDVKPVFISVDHGRDTAETVDDFTANVHPEMLGLTGNEEQVRAAAKSFRYVYQKQETGDEEYYLISHMTLSYLMDPEEGFLAAFSRELSGEDLARQMTCFLGDEA